MSRPGYCLYSNPWTGTDVENEHWNRASNLYTEKIGFADFRNRAAIFLGLNSRRNHLSPWDPEKDEHKSSTTATLNSQMKLRQIPGNNKRQRASGWRAEVE